MNGAQEAIAALQGMRINYASYEGELHALVAQALGSAGITYARERRIAPGCRVDFLLCDGTIIEVKKQKPTRSLVLQQLRRYAACEAVSAMVLVSPKGINALPSSILGKPLYAVALLPLWGIAL